jgi:septal ring factor EnvC (AmiA/AmiB activator)/uncharacterized protein YraI
MDRVLSVIKAVFKIVFLLLLVCILPTAVGAENADDSGWKGTVAARVLNIRSGPGEKYPIIGKLLKGGYVSVLETEQNWLKISHDDLEGYVYRQFVQLIQVSQEIFREGTVTARVLNIRSGPGEKYPIIGKLLKGEHVAVLATEQNWLKISHGDLEGYIYRQFVQLTQVSQEIFREGTVTARVLNIRSGPGGKHPIIGKLLKGEHVAVLATEQNWLKISHGDLEGYVSGQFVRLESLDIPQGDLTPAVSSESENAALDDEFEPSPFDPSLSSEELERLKQEAHRIGSQITEQEARVSAYTNKEAELIDELDQLGKQLNQTKLQVKSLQKEVASLGTSLKEIGGEIAELEEEIIVLDAYAAKRLVALYKLHQLGKMPVLASADSIFDMLSRKNAMDHILSADKAIWNELNRKKGEAESLRKSLADQKQLYTQNLEALDEQLAAMNRQGTARSKLLKEIRGEKTLMLAAIDSLKEAAFALDKQIDGNRWEIHPAGLFDEKNKKPFQTLKGLLQPPVPGKITGFYGLKKGGGFESASVRNGIDIEAEPGEPIRAVGSGIVIYADWFKGYGNLIIIDHGTDYCTVYAHAEELFKAKGDSVDMDEVIGTVGDTGSLAGTKLYFEIRQKGKPIDPLAWLKRD